MKPNFPTARWVRALLLTVAVPLGGVLAAGCAGKSKEAPRSQPPPVQAAPAPAPQTRPQTRPAVSRRGTLYERLGGEDVIRAVVDDFVTRAAADPAVNFTRSGHDTTWQATPANTKRLKERLVEFVVSTAGGPTQYRGRDMVTVHRGMAISNREFDALAGHLAAALQASDVPRREREEVLHVVASMRGAIVEAPDAPATEAPAEAPTAETDTAGLPGTESTPSEPSEPAFTDGESAPSETAPDAAGPGDAPAEGAPAPEMTGEQPEPSAPPEPQEPAADAPESETPAPDEAEFEPEL